MEYEIVQKILKESDFFEGVRAGISFIQISFYTIYLFLIF